MVCQVISTPQSPEFGTPREFRHLSPRRASMSLRLAPMSPHQALTSSHRMASVREFRNVLLVVHDVLLVVHDVSRCITMFYKCFMMFYYFKKCLASRTKIGIAASVIAAQLNLIELLLCFIKVIV